MDYRKIELRMLAAMTSNPARRTSTDSPTGQIRQSEPILPSRNSPFDEITLEAAKQNGIPPRKVTLAQRQEVKIARLRRMY